MGRRVEQQIRQRDIGRQLPGAARKTTAHAIARLAAQHKTLAVELPLTHPPAVANATALHRQCTMPEAGSKSPSTSCKALDRVGGRWLPIAGC